MLIGQSPILDTLLVGEESFVTDINASAGTHPFQTDGFDPRNNLAKRGTNYININKTYNKPSNPTDYSTAGNGNGFGGVGFTPIHGGNFGTVNLESLGAQFYNGDEDNENNLNWKNLYNANHTPKDNPSWQGLTPINYPNVNRDNLKIENDSMLRGIEPYIVTPIDDLVSNYSRGAVGNRDDLDVDRVTKFFSSQAGLNFILNQQALALQGRVTFIDKDGALLSGGLRFNRFYNPASTLLAVGQRAGGQSIQLIDRDDGPLASLAAIIGDVDLGLNVLSPYGNTYGSVGASVKHKLNDTFTQGTTKSNAFNFTTTLNDIGNFIKNSITGEGTPVDTTSTGDKMTLLPLLRLKQPNIDIKTALDNFQPSNTIEIDGEKDGMPFYFKDLRDNTLLVMRGYIEGLTETITPTWTPHNYIGRSEPVYTYDMAERIIDFSVKLFSQTEREHERIYQKMQRLTSMAYPEYYTGADDEYGRGRMKPPLIQMRMGDLYGTSKEELLGFLQAITYTVENTSPYEVKSGLRAPKYIFATLSFHVLHAEAPSLTTKFYGVRGSNAEPKDVVDVKGTEEEKLLNKADNRYNVSDTVSELTKEAEDFTNKFI